MEDNKQEFPQEQASFRYFSEKLEPNKKNVSSVMIFGDSLTDAGTMNDRMLFGLLPMSELAGLTGEGRFSDKYVWRDYFACMLIEKFISEEMDKERHPSTELQTIIEQLTADKLKTFIQNQSKKKNFWEPLLNNELNNDRTVTYKGQPFIRSYAEGGATANKYDFHPLIPARSIVSNLEEKLALSVEDDRKLGVPQALKKETLVIEWTGANDLITVNTDLTIDTVPTAEQIRTMESVAKAAVDARIKHIKSLYAAGYTNFVLLNLPDLGLTPRFNTKHGQINATNITKYFNTYLQEECQKLQKSWVHKANIEVFDINKKFTTIYNNVKESKLKEFDPNLINTPQKDAASDFYTQARCMFNDDVHPSHAIHGLLMKELMTHFSSNYNFIPPHSLFKITAQDLVENFLTLYKKKCETDKTSFFETKSNLPDNLNLNDILEHAFFKGGWRSREIMRELRWIDKYDHINPAYQEIMEQHVNLKGRYIQNYSEKEIALSICTLGFYIMMRELIDTEKMGIEEVAQAGLLATGFALTFYIAGPIILIMTAINALYKYTECYLQESAETKPIIL